ncbi:MAG: hypothetical protein WBL40_03370 [Terrimicrobiaceae bacterium]
MTAKSIESTSKAELYVDGKLVSIGEAALNPSEKNGAFWPRTQKLLDDPYPVASLKVAGMPDAVRVKNVHQCSGSPFRWEFVIA